MQLHQELAPGGGRPEREAVGAAGYVRHEQRAGGCHPEPAHVAQTSRSIRSLSRVIFFFVLVGEAAGQLPNTPVYFAYVVRLSLPEPEARAIFFFSVYLIPSLLAQCLLISFRVSLATVLPS
jgi:hypothetical protein